MRDAFGGAFMIKLLLIFLVIYISFMAVAINYAKAFKVKNRIIDIVEQNEGYTENAYNSINSYLQGINYYIDMNSINTNKLDLSSDKYKCDNQGYCLVKYTDSGSSYYRVYTFINISLFNLNITLPIKGETKVITNCKDSYIA